MSTVPHHFPLARFVPLILAFVIAACSSPAPAVESAAAPKDEPVSRKEQLLLEGVINDYCYRQNVKGDLQSVRCYANVSQQDIIVYVYPIEGTRRAFIDFERKKLAADLPEHIKTQFLDFPDWSWARSYRITVVDRTQ